MSGRHGGFTYLGILFAVAFMGVGLAATGTVWSLNARRSQERELLFVGHEFRQAIARYYRAGPGGVRQYPRSLEDLIVDRRTALAQRHLRRIYRDPITLQADWELIIIPDGSIIGVASRADGRPLKQANFDPDDTGFEDAKCYCDWRFVYLPEFLQRQVTAPGTGATSAAGRRTALPSSGN